MTDREFYNPSASFLCTGSDTPGGQGMECLQVRHQPSEPFHYLISEQAKSLQELQNEVSALLEFRELVIETFPNLRTKMVAGVPLAASHHSNIPVSIRTMGEWSPGVRVRKKQGVKEDSRSGKKSDIVQDSGFSTETSSKETHSASSTAPAPSTIPGVADDSEDELWNLLDIIHRKGTRLKDEVEALQGALRDHDEVDFHGTLYPASTEDALQLRHERDVLLDRMADMEAEVLASRIHTCKLQEEMEHLLVTKQDLEEQLRAVVTQRGEVNSRIHDLHSQFVTKSVSSTTCSTTDSSDKLKPICASTCSSDTKTSSQRTTTPNRIYQSGLDQVFSDKVPKVKVPDSRKIAAILSEKDPVILQKHLLNTSVQNQVLLQQVECAERLEISLIDKLEKAREDNEELKFQLQDKSIELEGTRARIRLLELVTRPSLTMSTSPDIIPHLDSTSPSHHISRSEITTASMKAMSPLLMDHTSSTESAHDHHDERRKSTENSRRRPSKIPLKSYTAPKPPLGGKHSPAPGARSRSGESPNRPHSAQSLRNSLSRSHASLPKSRNTSLVTSKDSLSCKLRSNDSLNKASFGSHRATLRKSTGTIANSNTDKDRLNIREKFQYPWTLSSYNMNKAELNDPDSLQEAATVTDISTSHRFQTANNFMWTSTSALAANSDYFDSIDSNFSSSLQHGEDLADYDSLEKQLSYKSDKNK